VVSHLFRIIFSFAIDASLICKASVSLDDFVLGHTCLALESVDVLSEAGV
jgi:hypothetical protein